MPRSEPVMRWRLLLLLGELAVALALGVTTEAVAVALADLRRRCRR